MTNTDTNIQMLRKKRLCLWILATLYILLIGFMYWLLLKWGIGLKCPFNELFHIDCPFCGLTRMVLALMDFRFYDAFFFQPVLMLLMPEAAYFYFVTGRRYIETGEVRNTEKETQFILLSLYLILLFGIVRIFMGASAGMIF